MIEKLRLFLVFFGLEVQVNHRVEVYEKIRSLGRLKLEN